MAGAPLTAEQRALLSRITASGFNLESLLTIPTGDLKGELLPSLGITTVVDKFLVVTALQLVRDAQRGQPVAAAPEDVPRIMPPAAEEEPNEPPPPYAERPRAAAAPARHDAGRGEGYIPVDDRLDYRHFDGCLRASQKALTVAALSCVSYQWIFWTASVSCDDEFEFVMAGFQDKRHGLSFRCRSYKVCPAKRIIAGLYPNFQYGGPCNPKTHRQRVSCPNAPEVRRWIEWYYRRTERENSGRGLDESAFDMKLHQRDAGEWTGTWPFNNVPMGFIVNELARIRRDISRVQRRKVKPADLELEARMVVHISDPEWHFLPLDAAIRLTDHSLAGHEDGCVVAYTTRRMMMTTGPHCRVAGIDLRQKINHPYKKNQGKADKTADEPPTRVTSPTPTCGLWSSELRLTRRTSVGRSLSTPVQLL
eukprot:Hpha_TRINITY_DN16794_c6_g2::TRINITY_DN16794_c6_g2_i10::g.78982::m.78982